MKYIGCLHAHHSNIPYIEGILTELHITASHFVDPGLIRYLKSHADDHQIIERVMAELEWIEKMGVDMIFITCTNYIALLDGIQPTINVPILKIDEPFFEEIKQTTKPVHVIFTNEGTVAGTLSRLHNYLGNQFSFAIEYAVIPTAFDLYMEGKTTEHDYVLSKVLAEQDFDKKTIAVAQLSMSNAAMKYSQETGQHIINPSQALKNIF